MRALRHGVSVELDLDLLGCCDLKLILFVIIDSSDSSRTIESPVGDVMCKCGHQTIASPYINLTLL